MTELALIFSAGLIGLSFAVYLSRWVLSRPMGEEEMQRVAGLIRSAAESFFRRQSSLIGALCAALGGAIFLAYGLLRRAGESDPVPALELGVWLTLSFAVGAGLCVVTGHVANWITTRASVRAANGARRSLDQALQIAIRAGAVSGVFIVAAGLLATAGLFTAVFAYKGGFGAEPGAALKLVPTIPLMIAGFPLGASFAAFLAQLGGGTFSKAADLGADVAGLDTGLSDDDSRNPATIADLAGDSAGDCAGRAMSVFQAAAAESLAAMLAGGLLFRENSNLPSALSVVLFPLVARAFGLVGAIFGVMVIKTDDREDPLDALTRGLYVCALLHLAGIAGAVKWLLGGAWMYFGACGLLGVFISLLFFHITQYYADQRYRPVRELAEACRAGPTAVVLRGLVIGVESTLAPIALVFAGTLGAYVIGGRSGLSSGGLFGMAVATIGMLGPVGYLLALDGFGPVVDNAGGIVEMTIARDRRDVRGRTVVLDTVGNTVKAISKSHTAAVCSMATMLFVASFSDEVRRRALSLGLKAETFQVRLDRPSLYIGALVGVLLVAWLAARCTDSVLRTSRRLIDEVRRQVRDRPSGVLPDHEACVEMVARAALRHTIVPAVVSVTMPVFVGLALRFARTEDNPLLAADAVAALIVAGTVAGVLGSLFMGNAGSAWDNAKKYIVTGAHGGRFLVDETGVRSDNPSYTAAVVGDTVGDPLKDAAGPAVYVLVKMLAIVTIVFLPFFI